MELAQLLSVLQDIAPLGLAEAWDNVGLLVGDGQQQVHKAMLAIDYTPAVAEEARHEQCDLIIAYHPPIFDALKRITGSSLIYDAIKRGLAIYSPHTALDVADGGTNDMLADVLGLEKRRPLRMSAGKAAYCKLVVFVPTDAADALARALFDAGAGHIGNYSCCSFRVPGTGTFFGHGGTHPTVGQPGRLEQADEVRLETILPLERIAAVVAALHQAHPYEEPAFDLMQLTPPPPHKGQGRIGELSAPQDRAAILERIKSELKLDHLLVAGPATGLVRTLAAGAGACGDMINDALAQRAEVYLTGEVRHHDALKAANSGMTVVCTLHSNSERAVLRRVGQRIEKALPQFPVLCSQSDADPFTIL